MLVDIKHKTPHRPPILAKDADCVFSLDPSSDSLYIKPLGFSHKGATPRYVDVFCLNTNSMALLHRDYCVYPVKVKVVRDG